MIEGISGVKQIDGVPYGNFHKRDDDAGGYHGQMVNTWMYDIEIRTVHNDIPVTVNGVPYGPAPSPVTLPSPPPPVPPSTPMKPTRAFLTEIK